MEQQTNMTVGRPASRAKKKKHSILPLLILLLFILIAGMVWFLFMRPTEVEEETGPVFAPNASVGALPTKTKEEIEEMLTKQITERTVAYTVNARPVFDTGTSKGNLMLESPANNINNIEFVIRRDDTGETVYRSGLLQPNQYIAEDKLLVDLDKGSYPCTVDITLYDPETFEAKGMTQAGITITVRN